jgi:hypothetical protein
VGRDVHVHLHVDHNVDDYDFVHVDEDVEA